MKEEGRKHYYVDFKGFVINIKKKRAIRVFIKNEDKKGDVYISVSF